MSAAHAPITPTHELTVAALRTKWLIPNPIRTPAASPGLFLFDISAACDDHEGETNKVKVAGPASSSPGPWLSVGLVDCLLSDKQPEVTKAEQRRYERLRATQESFREFRHDNDEVPAPFLGENRNVFNLNLLKGVGSIREKRGRKAKNTDAIPAFTPCTDKQLDFAYLQYASPSTIADPRGKLFEALFGFIKGRFPHAKGIKDLVQAGELDDALSEVVLEIMGTLTRKLERGEVLDGPACHYVTKAISNSRKGAAIDFADYKKTYLSDGYESEDSNEEYDSSRLDDIVDNSWLQGRFDSAPDAEYAEDIQDERKVWLRQQIEHGTLPAQLRAVAHLYFIQGKTQVECAEELGIAQGTISKHKGKIQEYIKMKKASK